MGESWLIVETSGRAGKVGLARGDAVVRAAALDPARRHARDLADTVRRLLDEERLVPKALHGVMVTVGPGGYTGLRVGLMSAKALAYATGCRLIPVPTFHALAEQAPAEATELMAVADALQDQIYVQRFARNPSGWTPTDELKIARAEDWLPWAAGHTWLTGPGLMAHAIHVPCSARLVPEADREPRIEAVFAAGRKHQPVSREELFALEPLYLRGSSAEEKVRREMSNAPPIPHQ